MPNPVAAVSSVVTTPLAAIKAHPVVWLVFFLVVVLFVLKYADTIAGWYARAPVVGDRAATFIG